ncbi:MAG: hypothetical protein IPI31_04805 [Bacteroidetes bacterium]|nr:hypothetical protein [Bacteroidota bacterium]
MLRIIIISVVCFVCTSVNGQNQNVVEKKIPHLYFPYEQVEKNSVQVKSASIIVDTDNDGVLDEFDKEINSPSGFPVDVFGVSVDSDNDGCLDFEDMEPFSSPVIPIENCVNIIVGGCDIKSDSESKWRGLDCHGIPMIFFDVNSINIGKEDLPVLNQVFEILKRYPQFKLNVSGSINNTENEELIMARVKIVTKYLLNQGISENRLVIKFNIDKENNLSSDLLDSNVAFNVIQ